MIGELFGDDELQEDKVPMLACFGEYDDLEGKAGPEGG